MGEMVKDLESEVSAMGSAARECITEPMAPQVCAQSLADGTIRRSWKWCAEILSVF